MERYFGGGGRDYNMKKDVAVIVVLSVIALGLVAACVVIFGFGVGKSKKVTDFEEIYFTTSPGRGKSTRYIIINEGEETKISISVTTSAKDGGRNSENGSCSTEEMIDLLNEYDALSWDGFDKKDKEGTIDFSFEGTINGKEIEAKGRGACPKDFEDFVDEVEDLCE